MPRPRRLNFGILSVGIAIEAASGVAMLDYEGLITQRTRVSAMGPVAQAFEAVSHGFVADFRGAVFTLDDAGWLAASQASYYAKVPGAMLVSPVALPGAVAHAVALRNRGYLRRVFTDEREAGAWAREQARLFRAQDQWRMSQSLP